MTSVESKAPLRLDLPAGQGGALEALEVLKVLETRIHSCRGYAVVLDVDLARIHGVSVNALLKAVDGTRCPGEFCFRLERHELAPAEDGLPGCGRSPRYAFTEYGALVVGLRLAAPNSTTRAVGVLRAFLNRRKKGEVPKHFA